MESPLIIKSKQFALNVIKICNSVKERRKESILTNQLLRSGTSIGANIRESNYAQGKKDFLSKLQIALKECFESEYWIELLIESNYLLDNEKFILEDAKEIRRILIKSCTTVKNNNSL